ncbi:protein SAWADEE HOMEODOMAIN HOMOLOG 1-like isoform X2 [Impatiens glandulifera]|uniref:protein SAWADEE HOMEODOMAIN HOMOLOG 1-like isoform X2 n=1 Tax=Impatiens glandulifera TaxID=253017 RepID=UPI001FB128CE|nr:protein SAWADEE HOMEODOMAIN HOMOLOG 1-like isoform X2 [Impatiens glandulifera]
MDRLRSRDRRIFSGFTASEIEKMEKLYDESGEFCLNKEFCKKIARSFNCSKGRAGQAPVKWIEVHSWFQDWQELNPLKISTSPNLPEKVSAVPEASPSNGPLKDSQDAQDPGNKVRDLLEVQFEALSRRDGAWYDVDIFLGHRVLSSGETEVHVRYIGFGAEEDEWVSVKALRERSVPLEHSECGKIEVGDTVICFQERRYQAKYYDATIVSIQRRMHDIRGCRCIFSIQYLQDETEEKVRLRRLCRRPT